MEFYRCKSPIWSCARKTKWLYEYIDERRFAFDETIFTKHLNQTGSLNAHNPRILYHPEQAFTISTIGRYSSSWIMWRLVKLAMNASRLIHDTIRCLAFKAYINQLLSMSRDSDILAEVIRAYQWLGVFLAKHGDFLSSRSTTTNHEGEMGAFYTSELRAMPPIIYSDNHQAKGIWVAHTFTTIW